jgi:ribosome-binding protein aMBF1 (putative translation factor)
MDQCEVCGSKEGTDLIRINGEYAEVCRACKQSLENGSVATRFDRRVNTSRIMSEFIRK